MYQRIIFLLISCISFNTHTAAQSFFKATESDKANLSQAFHVNDDSFEVFKINHAIICEYLSQAPLLGNNNSDVVITLPTIEGKEQFYVYESPCMMDGISAKYPFIKSYKIISQDNPSRNGRIAVGRHSISGVFQSNKGNIYIDPIDYHQAGTDHIFYYTKDQLSNVVQASPQALACGYHPSHSENDLLDESESDIELESHLQKNLGKLTEFQTYRMAIAATGEFTTNIAGGDPVVALERINVAVNRLNQIFENQLSIRVLLIDANDQLIWTDPNSDPYSNGQLGGQTLGQNTAVINGQIGAVNYDWGHVFTGNCTDGVAGIASLSVVCGDLNKGNGVTCFSNANIEAVTVRVMSHELGHQMSAPHSWNGCQSSAGQYASGDDFEPGSGSTIMSYAGLCGNDNVQNFTDDYYHSGSLKNIYRFMRDGVGSTCAIKTDLGNHAPDITLDYENGFYIPISTPFELEGTASDDEGDQLTYSWEQRDSSLSIQPLGEPFGRSPLFRVFYPDENSQLRTFPRLDRILNNNNSRTEVLPTYSRLMSFAFVVRDNHFEGGIASESHVRFFATEEAGPFMVSSQNNFESYEAGDKITVEWDVANTDQAPVDAKAVKILLSTDGGLNFDHILSSSTLNDGSEEVFIPQVISDDCRIKIKATENIFFDINDFGFTVAAASEPGFTLAVLESFFEHCAPNELQIPIGTESFLGYDSQLTLSLANAPSDLIYSFDKEQISSNETTQLNLDFSNFTLDESFDFEIFAISENQDTMSKTIQIDVTSNDFSSLDLLVPSNGATGIAETPFFKWDGSINADNYIFQLSTNPQFESSTTTELTDLDQDSVILSNLLEKSTIYYWRIIPVNSCGLGKASEINAFSTLTLGCSEFNATDLPKNISQSGTPEIESNIFITNQGAIADINVTKVFGVHEDVGDLRLSLISPQGTEIKLVTNKCFGANISCGFDDQAAGPVSCPLSANKTYRPEQPLEALIGEQYEGEWTLKVKDSDSGAGGQLNSFSLNVCGSVQTEAPYLVNNKVLEIKKGEGNRIADWRLKAEDGNNSAAELTYTLVTKPSHGTITNNGTALSIGDQFSQMDINNSLIRYQHNDNDASEDGFDFTVIDGEGGWIEITHFTILIDEDFASASEDILAAENRFTVHPIPTSDLLFLKQAEQAAFSAEIYDQQGRLIYDHKMSGVENKIDISTYEDGHYILKLTFDSYIQVEKILKF